MAARRLVIVMLVLLFVSTLAAALAPTPAEREETSTTATTTQDREPAGRARERTVRVGAGDPPTIALRLGDSLALTVRSVIPGEVEIAGLGELESVDPAAPARFELLPFEPGAYPVRMLEPARRVATIEVSESDRRAGRSAGTSRSR